MMDVVYPLGLGTRSRNSELKYSLRTLRNINFNKVFIVGTKPHWIKNINFVRYTDRSSNKQVNVIKKLLHLCTISEELSDDFILMNDDFFFLKPQKIKSYLKNVSLEAMRDKYPTSNYGEAVATALTYLNHKKLPTKNFEIHYPMIMNKQNFRDLFSKINFNEGAIVYRSVYGNTYGLTGEPVEDFKVYSGMQFAKYYQCLFVSTDNSVPKTNQFRSFMNKNFGRKSQYER